MCHLEEELIKICPKLKFYRRYVDDIFVVISGDYLTEFLSILNSFHQSIHFTFETEFGGIFSFLDIKIARLVGLNNVDGIVTAVFRKKTFTGLFINWESWCPKKYKISIIKALHERARRLCSSASLFELELRFIRRVLSSNGYPSKLLLNMEDVTRKLRDQFGMGPVIKVNQEKTSNNIIVVRLPFCGPRSDKIAKKLKHCIYNLCSDNVIVRVVFFQKKIASLFKFKDSYELDYANNVVYRINCPDCSSFYVGETNRRLIDRFNEHLMSSFGGQKGIFHLHCTTENHCLPDFNAQCTVIGSESHWFRRKIRESLLIKDLQADLNRNVASYSLELF